jgi:predicted site-specific integrase-resolvase
MPLHADDLPSHRLTHAQAAALLGVHPITVSTWVSQGKLPIVARHARANLLRSDVETLAASRWRHGEPG